MAQNKRYYWLKLHEEFFNQPVMKYLRTLPEGETIIIIYLKLLLISLKMDGYVYLEGLYPTLEEEIALILDENRMSVQLSLAALEKAKLLELGSGDYDLFLTRFPEMIGISSEGESAARMRAIREKKSRSSLRSLASHCDGDVRKCDADVQICDTEIEKEKKKDIEPEPEQEPKIYGLYKNVFLTDAEFSSLQQQFPSDYMGKISYFSAYMAKTGRSYDSHYLTICQWAKQDELKRPAPAGAKKSGFEDYSCEEGESF
ncbi:MAG: phage replisome organizer N-terminal domain-containing protein [Clostridia bacterium]|nr:phage replisome organizer N-terminal domain-containing protein [Clostridia bacterium]